MDKKLEQVEMLVRLEDLVSQDHQYRKFKELFRLELISGDIKSVEKEDRYVGYGAERLFLCILLQFMEDLSDRQMERYLRDNVAAKWFCGFGLCEKSPDHTAFCRIRSRLGTNCLSKIFRRLRNDLKEAGYMSEVFTFIDASHLIAKADLWKERDEAIKKQYEKLNNDNLAKVAHDKQAKIGCKGKDKYWYGYKKHASLDMQSGLINKIAVTPANVTDAKMLRNVCPNSGAVYADKGYCTKQAERDAKIKGVFLRAIKKNNMKDKNKDLDRWISGIRSPYERVFSKARKTVRYVGIAKNQFAEFMYAICFNLKRLTVISPPDKLTC